MQRKGNDRIINASLLMRTCIRHWGLLSLNANVQWKRPCTMPSGILFDVVSRYPPGFLCVPVDLYTGLPTRLLISMDASPEPSHSSNERGKRGSRGREITSRRRSNLYPLSLSVARVFYRTCKQIVAREIISFNQISQKKDAEFFETCTHVGCSLNRALLLPFRNATVLNGFHFHSNFLLTVHFVPSCREQLDPCLFVGAIGFILPRG